MTRVPVPKDFWKALGIWLLLTDGSALALFLQDSGLGEAQWSALLEIFVVTLICAGLLCLILRYLRSEKAALVAGLAVGFGVAILGGVVLTLATPGFESPAIFVGALMFSIPNAIGGALAGWVLGKAAFPNREDSSVV